MSRSFPELGQPACPHFDWLVESRARCESIRRVGSRGAPSTVMKQSCLAGGKPLRAVSRQNKASQSCGPLLPAGQSALPASHPQSTASSALRV